MVQYTPNILSVYFIERRGTSFWTRLSQTRASRDITDKLSEIRLKMSRTLHWDHLRNFVSWEKDENKRKKSFRFVSYDVGLVTGISGQAPAHLNNSLRFLLRRVGGRKRHIVFNLSLEITRRPKISRNLPDGARGTW